MNQFAILYGELIHGIMFLKTASHTGFLTRPERLSSGEFKLQLSCNFLVRPF
jgi:hypothetical protein